MTGLPSRSLGAAAYWNLLHAAGLERDERCLSIDRMKVRTIIFSPVNSEVARCCVRHYNRV
jgi:hypothetical protein